MEEEKQIINQSNIEETGAIQQLDSLSIKGEFGELMALYIQDMISKGGSIYKDVLDYLLDMDFISTEYISAICSFIQDNAALDWIMLIDTVLKTKESETIENFIREIYKAFKNDIDIQDMNGYVSLAKNPYELHIILSENEELNTLKKEYDKIKNSIMDVNHHLQQKKQEIGELKKELEESQQKLAESEKRKAYYEKSYKEACEETSKSKDETSKLKVELFNLKNELKAEQVKNKENIKKDKKEKIDINTINEKLKELFLKVDSVHEGILCISDHTRSFIYEKLKELFLKVDCVREGILCIDDHTSSLLEKGLKELLDSIKEQFKEELSNYQLVSQRMINQEENKSDEPNNNENAHYNVAPAGNEFFSPFDEEYEGQQPLVNGVEGEQDFDNGAFDYIGDMSNAGLYLEQEEEHSEELEDTKNSIVEENNNEEENDNEKDLPSDEEITNAKELLQTGLQSREVNKTIKNIEESSSFFLRFKKKIDINKKVKLFRKAKDDVKKRQMILEEAMANQLDTGIIRGLKGLSGMDTVSLEFLYQMACDKNTSIEDIMKLSEYAAP